MSAGKQIKRIFLCILAGMMLLTGCGAGSGAGQGEERQDSGQKKGDQATQEITRVPGGQIRILSGSEYQELETIIKECSEATGVESQLD